MLVAVLKFQYNFLQKTGFCVLRKHKFNNVKSTIKTSLIEKIK